MRKLCLCFPQREPKPAKPQSVLQRWAMHHTGSVTHPSERSGRRAGEKPTGLKPEPQPCPPLFPAPRSCSPSTGLTWADGGCSSPSQLGSLSPERFGATELRGCKLALYTLQEVAARWQLRRPLVSPPLRRPPPPPNQPGGDARALPGCKPPTSPPRALQGNPYLPSSAQSNENHEV